VAIKLIPTDIGLTLMPSLRLDYRRFAPTPTANGAERTEPQCRPASLSRTDDDRRPEGDLIARQIYLTADAASATMR
jgi:hypothetical protein